MQGVFQLVGPTDLRAKLRRDLKRFSEEPLNPDMAFNFFVTAEHMLDWVYPGRANSKRRTAEKRESALLRVCSHLANGAKHFEVEDPQHDSVKSTGTAGGYLSPSYFPSAYLADAYFGAGRVLVVRLGPAASAALAPVVPALTLAEQVLQYWDSHSLVVTTATARGGSEPRL